MKATYLALTTLNYQQNGYRVLVAGHNRSAVLERAGELVGNSGTDIFRQTENANLIVISKSRALRKHGIRFDDAQWMFDNNPECEFI